MSENLPKCYLTPTSNISIKLELWSSNNHRWTTWTYKMTMNNHQWSRCVVGRKLCWQTQKNYLGNIKILNVNQFKYLIGRKKVGKKWRVLLPMTNFFADCFFTDDYFYRRVIFTDKNSYRHFLQREHYLVFSNLKMPLIYQFDFKFD